MNSFQEFALTKPILRALADEQYRTPTPIQIATIPLVLARRDLVGVAQTGTGKTAAFALPILERLSAAPLRIDAKSCRVLVLSPTRELSAQIAESFRTYGRYLRVRVALAIGGISVGPQARALSTGADVLVATPGRLLDLAGTGAVRLGGVEVLVLDEADKMLDMGFIADIRRIVAKLPKQRQTLLFSATMPAAIAALSREILRDPVKVAVSRPASTGEGVDQRVLRVDVPSKFAALTEILRQEPIARALIFMRTKHGADKLTRGLADSGIAAQAIHGNKSQNQRSRVLAAFRDGRLRILVATDIAARGIDVEGISHVINYDLPNVPETYVHRIGRTARAGASGVAISLCTADQLPDLRAIETLIGKRIASAPHHAGPAARRLSHPQRGRDRYRTPERGNASAHEVAALRSLQSSGCVLDGGLPAARRNQRRRAG